MPPVIQIHQPDPQPGEKSPKHRDWENMGYHGFLWSSMVMAMESKRIQIDFSEAEQ
jgi:hypothetical protein